MYIQIEAKSMYTWYIHVCIRMHVHIITCGKYGTIALHLDF